MGSMVKSSSVLGPGESVQPAEERDQRPERKLTHGFFWPLTDIRLLILE